METTKHLPIKANPASQWTYCTVCFRDVSFDGSRHYVTAKATIAKRAAAA